MSIRLYQIGTQSLWLDEMFSVYLAKHSNLGMAEDTNPFLYYSLLKMWIYLTNNTETLMRVFSLIFSALAGVTLSVFFYRQKKKIQSLITLALWSVHLLSIEYSREVRMYSLVELGAVLNIIGLWYYKKSIGRIRSKMGYFISLMFLSATHYSGVLLGLIEFSIEIISKKLKKVSIKRRDIAEICFVISIVLLLAVLTSNPRASYLDWQSLRFTLGSFGGEVINFISYIFGGHPAQVVLFGILTVTSFEFLKKESFSRFLLIVVMASIVFGILISLLFSRVLIIPRYFIFLTPFVLYIEAELLAYCLQRSWWKRFLVVGFALTVGFFLPQKIKEVYQYKNAPWRDVAFYVSHIPNAIVLNTRSKSIQSPYFESHAIPVYLWSPDENGIQRLVDLLESRNNVFIVESFWGGLTYWEDLKAFLNRYGYKVNESNFQIENSEPLLLIQVRK